MAGCRPDVGAGAQGVAHDEEDGDKRQPQGQHCAQHLGSRPAHSCLHAYIQLHLHDQVHSTTAFNQVRGTLRLISGSLVPM